MRTPFGTPDDIPTSDVDHLLATYAVDVIGAVTAAQVFTPPMRRPLTGGLAPSDLRCSPRRAAARTTSRPR
jgi:hypothetical protein